MPKTKKRAASRRAERIEKAHSTELPEAKSASQGRRVVSSKRPPARGVARYPWATFFLILIIAAGLITIFYANHLGPFAPPVKNQPKPKAIATAVPTAVPTVPPADPAAAFAQATTVVAGLPAAQQKAMTSSPCLANAIISKITDTSAAPTAAEFANIQHTYSAAPKMTIDTKKLYCAGINTDHGLIVLELDPAWAPQTVNNFVFLAEHKFYDGIVFHRVNQYSGSAQPRMVQTGDPKGDGSGGPGYTIADETVKGTYTPGTVAMANTGQPHSGGSQFFINVGDNSSLPKSYNLFGQVVKGLDVAFQIQGPGDDASTKGIKPDVMNHVIVVPAS
jgi:cyclophilin family peptidyl-prolyl cis-trans isomerase